MIIEKEHGVGCNFCNRGKMAGTGIGLVFPYDFIHTICRGDSGPGLKAKICEDCVKELFTKLNMASFTKEEVLKALHLQRNTTASDIEILKQLK